LGDNNGNEHRSLRDNLEACKTPVIKVTCGKCGMELLIHAPMVTINADFYRAVMILTPTWSLDERICPGCGTAYAPAFKGMPSVEWVEVPAPELQEKSRIIQPNMLLKPDFNPGG